MSRNLSATALQALYAQETGEVFLVLLTLTSPQMGSPIRVVNNTEDVVSNGNTFVKFPFDITFPDEGEDRAPVAQLRIDNIDRQIVQAVRDTTDVIKVTIEWIRAADPDTIEVSFPDFELTDVQYDELHVRGRLTLDSFLEEPFPADTFNPGGFPGMF